MYLEFAPMEGVTNYIYRRLHAEFFPGADRYYAPFIAPDGSGRFKASRLRDILPENNADICLVPQLLCNNARSFLSAAEELAAMGYGEVNLNAGCPSATVVPKHKGAGMLTDIGFLESFLDEVFSRAPIKVSVKTRLGIKSAEEFPAIIDLYRRYPLACLIIHARDREGFYKSKPDTAAFAEAFSGANPFPVCYNGDIFSIGDAESVCSKAAGLDRLMLGRGAAANPALFRVLRGGDALCAGELKEFHSALLHEMIELGLSEHHALARMKELWFYMGHMFPGGGQCIKRVSKAQHLEDYTSAVNALFSSGYFSPAAFVPPR